MSENPRETFLNAARDSYAAMWPLRVVKRGLELAPEESDARLRNGLVCIVGGRVSNWTEYTGGEARNGELEFAVVMWGHLEGNDQSTEHVEQLEAELEWELLQWCQAIKPGPLLDAVVPLEVVPSSGIDAPYAWIVARLKGLYV